MVVYTASFILIGVLLTLIFVIIKRWLVRWYKSRPKLIKSYWIFSVLFAAITTVAYILVIWLFSEAEQELAVNVLGQASALIFAIFVGYFAFAQVAETRKEKLDKKGLSDFRKQDYGRAILNFEQAFSINTKDASTLGNLIEAYIISKDFQKAEEKLPLYQKLAIDGENITALHLETGLNLLKGRLLDADESITATIKYAASHPDQFKSYGWSFEELRRSPSFNDLKGELKQKYINYINYVERGLSPENNLRFESGDFLLKPITK